MLCGAQKGVHSIAEHWIRLDSLRTLSELELMCGSGQTSEAERVYASDVRMFSSQGSVSEIFSTRLSELADCCSYLGQLEVKDGEFNQYVL